MSTDQSKPEPHTSSNGKSSVAGIILAGTFSWANSAFNRLSARPLIPVAHRPLFSYALSWLRTAPIEEIFVCGNRDTRTFNTDLMGRLSHQMRFRYLEDRMPRGAAGCVRDAGSLCDCDTLVVADGAAIPTVDLPSLLAAHERSGAAATVVVFSESWGQSATHTPAGVYVFDREVLGAIPDRGFCDIKEYVIPKLFKAGRRVVTYPSSGAIPRVLNEHTYLAVNEFAIHLRVSAVAAENGYRRQGEALIHSDASVADSATLVGPLLVGPGASIHRRAVVVGPTSIGPDVTVGQGALVFRSALWRRSTIHADSVVDRSIVPDGVVVERGQHEHQIVVTPRQPLLGNLA